MLSTIAISQVYCEYTFTIQYLMTEVFIFILMGGAAVPGSILKKKYLALLVGSRITLADIDPDQGISWSHSHQ